ncbi:transposase [Staphylococcus hyicus]|uniref:transposase n=1 Tax=Staphylococcus hyicus TaxID=1284 RepID=UPI003C799107
MLLSIHGFGRLTTALFIGELGDIRRFSSYKKLSAYMVTERAIQQRIMMRHL